MNNVGLWGSRPPDLHLETGMDPQGSCYLEANKAFNFANKHFDSILKIRGCKRPNVGPGVDWAATYKYLWNLTVI